MKATDILRLDHRALETLFSQYESAAAHPDERKELYERIRVEMELHSEIEEEIFLPALRESQPRDTSFPVTQVLHEGQRSKELLREISTLDPVEDAFDDRMHELRQDVERHIREAEAEMFTDAAEHLTGQKLEELGRQMEELRLSLRRDLRRRKTA